MIRRQPLRLLADPSRVVARPLTFGDEGRVAGIVDRVIALGEEEVTRQLRKVQDDFAHRHPHFEAILESHYRRFAHHLPAESEPSRARTLLLGAYFTMEYSFEAAALFNPSIVPHPEQDDREGTLQVILSLRATGEGHISSLEFRSGEIAPDGTLTLDPPSHHALLPHAGEEPGELVFPADSELSERLIFPVDVDERGGIEDARWVLFQEAGEKPRYYGTYTAYDGVRITPKLLETEDFLTFRRVPLQGAAVRNKGFALFPRRVNGCYVMLSRQDNENNFIMFSDVLHRWEEAQLLSTPRTPREFIQIGNNGSPIETEAGWLVLTHGVGPMRRYTLGVDLLDLNDPAIVIASLDAPLLAPEEDEREGYVPNVLYTCGALLHNGNLVIPYALSDAATSVASVSLDDLLAALGV